MRKNLFLFLALACFIGLVAVFLVDGYLGVYDTVYVTTGEQSFRIEYDVWQRQYPTYAPVPIADPYLSMEEGPGVYFMAAGRGDSITFRYEVDNRLFSTYQADIQVSVWHSQEKVRDVKSEPMLVPPFDKGEVEWALDNTELVPGDILPEESYQYTLIIQRGDLERRIIVSVNPIAFK